jgi:hypothetical protein
MARPSRPAIPDALQREVLTPGVLCTYCTEVPADTIDHVVPVSRGGPTIRGNLVAACRRCNSRKNARPVEDFNPGRRLTPTEIDELGQAAEKVRTWTAKRNALIRAAFAAGGGIREIAKATGLNVGTVHTMLHGRKR